MTGDSYLESSAIISKDGQYRYRLTRRWADGPQVLWVMLNPSTADGDVDDPTIRRCVGFSKAWGFAGIQVVNLWAYRSTNPQGLLEVKDPFGSQNSKHLDASVRDAALVVAAWGAHVDKMPEGQQAPWSLDHFARRYKKPIMCLGTTKAGHPRHPLYIPGSQVLEVWNYR